jgi:hypothetical protein
MTSSPQVQAKYMTLGEGGWMRKSGQYDDLDGASLRILPDDDIEE